MESRETWTEKKKTSPQNLWVNDMNLNAADIASAVQQRERVQKVMIKKWIYRMKGEKNKKIKNESS